MARKSSGSSKRCKPTKPRADFPLYPHASGKWAKVIKGQMYYFGRWDDPFGAEREFLKRKDELAGRTSRAQAHSDEGPTIRDVCNAFIKAKKTQLELGKLSPRTFVQYDVTCRMLLDSFGRQRPVTELGPINFDSVYGKMAKQYSVTSLGGQITQVRSVFKYAYESGMIEKPVTFGPLFKSPSKTDIRKFKAKQKHTHGAKTFTADEIRQMLEVASTQLRAMIFLGINGGMGNTDCSSLPITAMDLEGGWLDYPRQKTGVERVIPLWPETIEALKRVVAERKEPNDPDDASIVFVTLFRQRWVRYSILDGTEYGKKKIKAKQDDGISKATAKLLKELDLKRPGLSFYSLRHTFETIAGGCQDQVAVDSIMGHIDSSMAANYRHGIEDDRLRAVVNHVHSWLFGEREEQPKEQPHQLRIVG